MFLAALSFPNPASPQVQQQRLLTPAKERDRPFVEEQLGAWEGDGFVREVGPTESARVTTNAPIMVATVFNTDGTLKSRRLCLDLRAWNKGLVTLPFRVPY